MLGGRGTMKREEGGTVVTGIQHISDRVFSDVTDLCGTISLLPLHHDHCTHSAVPSGLKGTPCARDDIVDGVV